MKGKAECMQEWQTAREASTGRLPVVRSGVSRDGLGRESGGEMTIAQSKRSRDSEGGDGRRYFKSAKLGHSMLG